MSESKTHAIVISDLVKSFGERHALDGISLEVHRGELFCLLGPNGGGKSTLFRILATLSLPDSGAAKIAGHDVVSAAAAVRSGLGVVFQSPSLDGKLTILENLRCGGALYGLTGTELESRITEASKALNLIDRLNDIVETLSGGLQRRAEIAKCLLIRPEVLLLDEPSTGLDPGARLDLWAALEKLRSDHGVTALCTTHLMEEAARADRVGIVSSGKLVALGTPDELTAAIGGDVISLCVSKETGADQLAKLITSKTGIPATVVEGEVRIEHGEAYALAARLAGEFPKEITSLRIARPTLEDVFIARTGRLFADQDLEPDMNAPVKKKKH
ncbi:MAG: ATP-binding cassette domain-containing protein [Chthoniobacterales bacterium]|nr:ATP-binding cassette domain-containing protein [Chthoniobacterales bacterium]